MANNEQEEQERYRYLQLKMKMGNASAPSAGIPVPKPVQYAAQFLTGPGRLTRGLGVGAERLISGDKPIDAGAKASAAMQPGYTAPQGEQLGSFVGGLGDPINLAMNAVLPGSGLVKSAASGAASAAGGTLLDQLSQGNINTDDLRKSSAWGLGMGALTHGMGKLPSTIVQNAPSIVQMTSKIPKRATSIFMRDKGIMSGGRLHPDEESALLKERTFDVQKGMQDVENKSKAFYDRMVNRAKAQSTPKQLAEGKPIAPTKIAETVEGMKREITQRFSPLKENPNFPISAAKRAEHAKGQESMAGEYLRRLLHIRSSIDNAVSHPSGMVRETMAPQEKGLSIYRKEVNDMIESLPKGRFIRGADKSRAVVKDVFGKLQRKLERPGETLEYLRDVFSGKGPNADEDLQALLLAEKMVGKPIINDLFKALTKAQFSETFGEAIVKRSIAGFSPFLISALMRVGGVPFQASLLTGAAATTLAQMPFLVGKGLRASQEYGPGLAKAAGPTGVAALNLIRQRRRNENSDS